LQKLQLLFHIFKSKPYLGDLIPDGHVDFHSHLLYGIDDGAQAPDDTLFLVREFINSGISQCITTPHIMTGVWDNTREIIENRLADVRVLLNDNGIDLPLRAAAEYLIDDNFRRLFQSEKLLTIKDNYVLVEMSYLNPPLQVYEILFELQLAGYVPVLAHPERYTFFHHSFGNYEKLKNAGCLFQLNLLSSVGYYGKEVTKTAEILLRKGMIDFAGSDVHHKNHIKVLSNKILFKDAQPLSDALANNAIFSF
jgi:tyrosine-protein phosphatase YwqE